MPIVYCSGELFPGRKLPTSFARLNISSAIFLQEIMIEYDGCARRYFHEVDSEAER
jgi:hypothetical protein